MHHIYRRMPFCDLGPALTNQKRPRLSFEKHCRLNAAAQDSVDTRGEGGMIPGGWAAVETVAADRQTLGVPLTMPMVSRVM